MGAAPPSDREPANPASGPGPVLRGFGVWVLYAGFYLLLAGTVALTEILAAATAATLATALGARIRARSARRFNSHPRWVMLSGRILRHVAHDCVVVSRAVGANLLRAGHPTGEFSTLDFAAETQAGETAAEAAARRVLVTIGISLAPNTYVAVVDAEADKLVVHHLAAPRGTQSATDRVWPL